MRDMKVHAAAMNATLTATVGLSRNGSDALSNFATQAGLAARRFIAFTAAAGTMVRLAGAIRDGIKEAVAFDLQMNKLAQVSSDSSARINGVRNEIGRLSTTLGVSSSKLADVAITFKQAGLAANQLKGALQAVALSDLAPNFDSMAETTEGLIASWKQFRIQAKDFQAALGSINAVAGEFAVEAGDIVTAVQKAGGAFAALAGQSKSGLTALNEFQALFTSVRATTRESADTIATGLRTVFTRLQRSDTVSALKDLQINLRYTNQEAKSLGDLSLENQFVGAYEAVRRLSQGLAGLRTTDPRFAQVVEQLGGYRQISKVIPLLQQFGTAKSAVNVAMAGQVSLQIAQEKRQESLANKTSKLKEEYLDLARQLVQSDGFQGIANSIIKMADGFATVMQYAAPLVPVLTSLAAIKLTTNLGSLAANFGRSFAAPVGASVAPRRFARGGVVPGVGNTDSIPAQLMPGEFVVKKTAPQSIGYSRLQRLNDEGRVSRYATGGEVAARIRQVDDNLYSSETLTELLRNIQRNSGVPNILKGATSIRTASPRQTRGILGGPASGFFDGPSGNVVLSKYHTRRNANSLAAIRLTLEHELVHGLDRLAALKGGNGYFASQTPGNPLYDFAEAISPAVYRVFSSGGYKKDKHVGLSYYSDNREKLAHGFNTFSSATGHSPAFKDEDYLKKILLKEEFDRVADTFHYGVKPYLRKLTADGEPGLGAFLNAGNRKTFGGKRIPIVPGFGFATGGRIPGAGDSDTVPALLTPGEFVLRKTARSIGAARLHHMNKTGRVNSEANKAGRDQRGCRLPAREADSCPGFPLRQAHGGHRQGHRPGRQRRRPKRRALRCRQPRPGQSRGFARGRRQRLQTVFLHPPGHLLSYWRPRPAERCGRRPSRRRRSFR